MKPVKDLVDLVVLILTQTTDGSRLEVVSARALPSSRSGSTSFMRDDQNVPGTRDRFGGLNLFHEG